jgi:hypothetical protein
LNVFEEDGTRSIRTVSREMGLFKSSVQRVPADNRRHPYHYTGVQHLLSEDYPIRREFYLWLINQNDAPHFLSRILFSDEILPVRLFQLSQPSYLGRGKSKRIISQRFQHRFSVDWAIGRSFGKLKFRIPGSRLDRFNSPQD